MNTTTATASERGTVRWFDAQKGFGFLAPDRDIWHDGQNSKRDIFVHFTGIAAEGYRELQRDQRVAFDVVKDDRGRLIATNVRVIS